jgi:hypothetical protein
MPDQRNDTQEYSEQETKQRRDDAIRRALNTPPKPHKEMVGKDKRNSEPEKDRAKTKERP